MPKSQQRSWLVRPLPPLLDEWWTDLEGEGLALNTRLAYVRDLTDVSDYLASQGKDLATATAEDLLSFTRQMTILNLALATRSRHITAFRMFYEWLRRRRGQTSSIAQDLRPPKRRRSLHKFWTDAQVRQ